jgi:very-short-patch-repair endonuclease
VKEEVTATARRLRKCQTTAESLLWQKLRNRRFLEIKFVRQHPIRFTMEGRERFFIADFFCFEKKLIIEVDGDIHLKQKEHDQFRDLVLQQLGFRVLHVTNKMIMDEIDFFLCTILSPLCK